MGKWGLSGATRNPASPHTALPVALWEPDISDIKTYKHFDGYVSPTEIAKFVRDPDAVARHTFRPLIHFEKKWRRAPKRLPDGTLEKRKPKIRPIRYGCRRDAYVFKHYRELLVPAYERRLAELGLGDSILAYRRIPVQPGSENCKSNIHFAKTAFDHVSRLGRCCAIAIDISSYFDSINHERLKRRLMELLDVERLSADYFAVFKAVTQYRYVDINNVMLTLGYSAIVGGVPRYLRDPKDIPSQLCRPKEYREKIVLSKIIRKHDKPYGIPQGTPISDILANLFLIDFDKAMHAYATQRGGVYFRYSDDILLILPGDGRTAKAATKFATSKIAESGTELVINADKTEIVCYTPEGTHRCYALKPNGASTTRVKKSENDGLSYLGFRYDGAKVYLRNGTISNLNGKITRTCLAMAYQHVNGHKEKDLPWLLANAPYDEVTQKFLRVKDFEEAVAIAEQNGDPAFSVMTFWSYVRRAQKIFGTIASPVPKQLRNINRIISAKLQMHIERRYNARKPLARAVSAARSSASP